MNNENVKANTKTMDNYKKLVNSKEENINTSEPLNLSTFQPLNNNNEQLLFAWSIKTGEEPGLACSDYPDPNIQPQPPIDHKVRKKIIEIYLYCVENDSTFDLGSYETVSGSKPSISKYNSQDHIFYSKYGKTHSDIHAIPIVEETRNVFDYCGSIYNYNGVFVPDERTSLMATNLNPYSSNSPMKEKVKQNKKIF
jgi:hypothetical protein